MTTDKLNTKPLATGPTVFVVDDDPGARQSVLALVESMGLAVETFESAEQFLATFDSSRPGCLVTDFRMLGMSGLELQEALAREKIKLPVIVITAYADVPTAVRAMKRGAITLLEKPCHDLELVANIRRAIEMDADLRRDSARVTDIQVRLQSLSDGEKAVVARLLKGKMNKNIAKELDLGLRTVELRRHQIMKKMGVDSVAELVHIVLEAGGLEDVSDEGA